MYTFAAPLEFLDFSLCFRSYRENKLSSREILQNCVTLLGNSTFKNHDPWKFHHFLLNTPVNFSYFLIDPWNFHTMLFLQYIPLEIPYPKSPIFLFGFFLEQPNQPIFFEISKGKVTNLKIVGILFKKVSPCPPSLTLFGFLLEQEIPEKNREFEDMLKICCMGKFQV